MILCLIADGRSIHTQRWAEYFSQKGHEVHLVTYDPMHRSIDGVTEHVVSSRWQNLYLSYLSRDLRIRHIVREIRPDLIHAHFIAKYGFHLPGLRFHPSVVSAWGDDVLILPQKSRLIERYTRKVLRFVDLVYAISQNIGDHVVRDFAIPEEKVKYLPFGIDTDLFSPSEKPGPLRPDRIAVFSNRGFHQVYDNETLVRGFAIAWHRDPRFRLTLKGDGPEKEYIRGLIGQLGLGEVASIREKTDYRDVPDDYRNADIFVTTSRSDGTPVSILEAMASGLPCIATTIGGIPEWIEDKKTGLLIPPGSPGSLADALLALAGDPDLILRLGRDARAAVVARGQWKTLMAQAEKDYQELVRTYSRRS